MANPKIKKLGKSAIWGAIMPNLTYLCGNGVFGVGVKKHFSNDFRDVSDTES